MKKRLILFIAVVMMLLGTTVSAYASCQIATLMYHDITPEESRWTDWCTSPDKLREDILYFTKNGYIPITATELAEESMDNLDGKKILLITFDDGYDGFYHHAFPVLKELNCKATMFIIGSHIGDYGFMTNEQIYEMANSGLVEMGSHTNYLHRMPKGVLSNIYNNMDIRQEVYDDLNESNELISGITGKSVTSISWPYGLYSLNLDKGAKDNCGYKISFSTDFGVNLYNGDAYSRPFNRMNREHSITSECVYQRAQNLF